MLFMTAKVDKKKLIAILAAIAAVLALLLMFTGGGDDTNTAATASQSMATNDARVQFLKDFGWDVAASPVESGQVKIPEASSQVFDRYNALQKSQGYDLSRFAGKTVMRYVYKIKNYPGATDPVYATLLVYKDQVIGGDVTDTSAKGVIRGFQMPGSNPGTTATVPTQPIE